MKRLLDNGQFNGVREWHEYDELTDETRITYEGDATPLLDLNKSLYNEGNNGYISKAKEMKHVANIPNIVALKWLMEEGIDIYNDEHWPAVRRKLNDPEYLHLRTSPGKI